MALLKSGLRSMRPLLILCTGAAFCLNLGLSSPTMADEASDPSMIEADMVLGELNHLAEELEKQRKFSRILLKKIDEMQDRIDLLEADNSGQPLKGNKSDEAAKARKASPGDEAERKAGQKDRQAEREQDKQRLPEDFEQFLDMGEAMLRRFFGVVREFRKEFEDNRA